MTKLIKVTKNYKIIFKIYKNNWNKEGPFKKLEASDHTKMKNHWKSLFTRGKHNFSPPGTIGT